MWPVSRDGSCQFHALHHSLKELEINGALHNEAPPIPATSSILRASLVDAVVQRTLPMEFEWCVGGDNDRAARYTLEDHLAQQAFDTLRKERPGVRVDALGSSARLELWARCMRDPYTYGDGVSLCAAAIIYRVSIYVVSAMTEWLNRTATAHPSPHVYVHALHPSGPRSAASTQRMRPDADTSASRRSFARCVAACLCSVSSRHPCSCSALSSLCSSVL